MRRVAEPHLKRGLWLRALWPDRNPLRRRSDRIEAAIVAVALVAFLVGAPLVALFAGRWAYAAAQRVEQAQQSSWRQVTAVLLDKAPGTGRVSYGGMAEPEVRARWTAPDGASRTGLVPAPGGAAAHSTVRIWVDASGRVTGPPLRHDQATGQVWLAAVTAPMALGVILLCAESLAMRTVNRRRIAAWDADWQATGPRWTSRR